MRAMDAVSWIRLLTLGDIGSAASRATGRSRGAMFFLVGKALLQAAHLDGRGNAIKDA